MKHIQLFVHILVSVFICGAIAVALYLSHGYITQFLAIKDREVRSQGFESCAIASTATWKDANNAMIVEPYKPVYEQCLKDRGIK